MQAALRLDEDVLHQVVQLVVAAQQLEPDAGHVGRVAPKQLGDIFMRLRPQAGPRRRGPLVHHPDVTSTAKVIIGSRGATGTGAASAIRCVSYVLRVRVPSARSSPGQAVESPMHAA